MQLADKLNRSASLDGYVELVSSLGRDPYRYLKKVGLSARLLDNPETLIPSRTVRELLEITAQDTGVEDFALQLAARRASSNLGPISLVLNAEPTPRIALDTLCRYLRLLSATLVTQVEDVGSTVVIREQLLPIPGLGTRQAIELAVAVMFRILRELIGPHWRPQQVCFTHRPPGNLLPFRQFFGRLPAYNQSFNGLVCASSDLHMQRVTDNPSASRFARDFLDSALQRNGEGVRTSCRKMIMALLPGGRCTAEQLASLLNINRRTLHRHLRVEGLTFSLLLDQVRLELASKHLKESDLPVGEIAALLGFSSNSSFSHWFRATVGCSVSEWRRKALLVSN